LGAERNNVVKSRWNGEPRLGQIAPGVEIDDSTALHEKAIAPTDARERQTICPATGHFAAHVHGDTASGFTGFETVALLAQFGIASGAPDNEIFQTGEPMTTGDGDPWSMGHQIRRSGKVMGARGIKPATHEVNGIATLAARRTDHDPAIAQT